MSRKSLKQLREEQPTHLNVIWCDRCNGLINLHDQEHFHSEQCGCCKKYLRLDADWGYCSNHDSLYCGRKMFEHDSCSKWIEGDW